MYMNIYWKKIALNVSTLVLEASIMGDIVFSLTFSFLSIKSLFALMGKHLNGFLSKLEISQYILNIPSTYSDSCWTIRAKGHIFHCVYLSNTWNHSHIHLAQYFLFLFISYCQSLLWRPRLCLCQRNSFLSIFGETSVLCLFGEWKD